MGAMLGCVPGADDGSQDDRKANKTNLRVTSKAPLAKGQKVNTPYGVGVIEDIRPDGFRVVKMENFEATAFLQQEQIEQLDSDLANTVMTPYGPGLIEEVRDDGFHVVKMLAFGATAYLQPEQIQKPQVKTP